MRYWWVNQNQTYRHEVAGGYLWSPKRNANGHRNQFYDFMREVAPGDIVFSFCDGFIKGIGVAVSNAYEAPKPLEFGKAGAYWDRIGWRVDVGFIELKTRIRPVDHMGQLGPKLPPRYSPLQSNGHGLQGVYLTYLPDPLAATLIDLIGREARNIIEGSLVADKLVPMAAIGLLQWEEHELQKVATDRTLEETTRQAVVQARRGQGLFKQNVMKREAFCRLTRVDRVEHLRASHCKPWRDASNRERLDGENGLLLTPDADHLFDRGFLSFDGNGDVLWSPVAHIPSLVKMGLDPKALKNVGSFSESQKGYLAFHRENVFLQTSYKF
ncbi:HNH endonuclease [Arenimonas daejeonensis]|uniref:HNH endonuclease n=1 Tax=Arenimonas daejeonensis TaxID=370777 RepID=UPI0011BD6306|nr:HNH endonuclease [Arenimonas daejeonensis]